MWKHNGRRIKIKAFQGNEVKRVGSDKGEGRIIFLSDDGFSLGSSFQEKQ